MTWTDAAVGLAILIGILGIIVPVLPGSLLILVAVIVWAIEVGGTTAWTVAGIACAILVVGNVVKYLLPGKKLKQTVPTRTLLVGAALALVGFFVIPVVGMFVGFPLGIYLAERVRVGPALAGSSTKQALRAVGVSILIELAAALLAAAVWTVGVILT